MNAKLGWALAVAALVVGWYANGGQGLIMAFSVVVFWLLLQFSRALRVMRKAAEQPIGRIGSAVMMQAKLVAGMTMMRVVTMTRSLGRKLEEKADTQTGMPDEVWQWEDDGGVLLTLHFNGGKLSHWLLERPAGSAPEAEALPSATP
jgi:hypothetical protein